MKKILMIGTLFAGQMSFGKFGYTAPTFNQKKVAAFHSQLKDKVNTPFWSVSTDEEKREMKRLLDVNDDRCVKLTDLISPLDQISQGSAVKIKTGENLDTTTTASNYIRLMNIARPVIRQTQEQGRKQSYPSEPVYVKPVESSFNLKSNDPSVGLVQLIGAPLMIIESFLNHKEAYDANQLLTKQYEDECSKIDNEWANNPNKVDEETDQALNDCNQAMIENNYKLNPTLQNWSLMNGFNGRALATYGAVAASGVVCGNVDNSLVSLAGLTLAGYGLYKTATTTFDTDVEFDVPAER